MGQMSAVIYTTDRAWELVIVNNASQERTAQIECDLHAAAPRVKLVDSARNLGHQLAVTAGLEHARGDDETRVAIAGMNARPRAGPRKVGGTKSKSTFPLRSARY